MRTIEKVGTDSQQIKLVASKYGLTGDSLVRIMRGRLPGNENQVECMVECATVLWEDGALFELILWCRTKAGPLPSGDNVAYKVLLDNTVQERASDIITLAKKKGNGGTFPYDLMKAQVKFTQDDITLQVTSERVSTDRQDRIVPELSPERMDFLSYERYFARKCLEYFGIAIESLMNKSRINVDQLAEATGIHGDKLVDMYVSKLTQSFCARRARRRRSRTP